jgi:hypothetical protein
MKIAYDILLYLAFRRNRPPEEGADPNECFLPLAEEGLKKRGPVV